MSEDVVLLQKMVRELTEIVAKQKEEIAFLKRHIFGKKSERFIAAPGQLSIEGLGVEIPEPSPAITQVKTVEKEK